MLCTFRESETDLDATGGLCKLETVDSQDLHGMPLESKTARWVPTGFVPFAGLAKPSTVEEHETAYDRSLTFVPHEGTEMIKDSFHGIIQKTRGEGLGLLYIKRLHQQVVSSFFDSPCFLRDFKNTRGDSRQFSSV